MTTLPRHQPKYRAIADAIRARIAEGQLAYGARLPSEHDLALEFHVAYATVRQAISDLVREGLLRRVHGRGTYVCPEPSAVTPPYNLAFVIPSLTGLWRATDFYSIPAIVEGFNREAARLGYDPIIIGGSYDVYHLAQKNLKGIACLLLQEEDTETLSRLRDLALPLVCINAYRGRRIIPSVTANQSQGMEEAVALLARLGHRRIAFLPSAAYISGAEERAAGFLKALKRRGLEPVQAGRERGQEISEEASAALKLLALPDPPTAFIAESDLIAVKTLQTLRGAGFCVPGDLSLIGFGDSYIAQYQQPALTTVRLPFAQLGSQAAHCLDDQRNDRPRQRHIALPVELMERETVGPPRRAPAGLRHSAPTPILPSPRFVKSSR